MEELIYVIGIIVITVAVIAFMIVMAKKRLDAISADTFSVETDMQADKTSDELLKKEDAEPMDMLLDSPHYSRYESLFNYMRAIFHGRNEPGYKFEWLLQSLEMGRELEDGGSYVRESIENDLPYFCETASEYHYFNDDDTPILRGSVQGILDLMLQYSLGAELEHPSKLAYWQQIIREMARSGNMEAQAALCSAKSGAYKSVFPEDEPEQCYNRYYSALLSAAESGNPYAQLAVGEFLTPYRKRKELLSRATRANLTDAWYQLGKVFSSLIYTDDDGIWRGDTLPPDEKKVLMEKEMECYIHASEANNGIMAGWCQSCIATWYRDGDGVLPLDLKKAKYWFEKAAENGMDVRYFLESLEKRLNE